MFSRKKPPKIHLRRFHKNLLQVYSDTRKEEKKIVLAQNLGKKKNKHKKSHGINSASHLINRFEFLTQT